MNDIYESVILCICTYFSGPEQQLLLGELYVQMPHKITTIMPRHGSLFLNVAMTLWLIVTLSIWILNLYCVMIKVFFLRYRVCETGIENTLWKCN